MCHRTLSDPLVPNRDTSSLSLLQPIREIHKTLWCRQRHHQTVHWTANWSSAKAKWKEEAVTKTKTTGRGKTRKSHQRRPCNGTNRVVRRFGPKGAVVRKGKRCLKEYYRMGWRLQALLVPRGPISCFLGFANRNALTSSIGIAYRTRLSLSTKLVD